MSDFPDGHGADAVVRALEDENVPFTFGIPGTHNIELYDRLARSPKVRPILVTDEQSASFMADGLWRASGLLGCVNVVPGAGLTHALSGIAEAYLDNVPMLVLGCGVRRDIPFAYQLHDIDQLAVARPVVKAVLRAERPAQIYPAVRRACALARAGSPGPAMVEIPANLYLRPAHDPAPHIEPGELPPVPVAPPPSKWEPVAGEAADVLAECRRPLLYVGNGARGAGAELVRLAELLEAPVATTLQGKGVFPETHPLSLWPGFGAAAPPFARRVAASCDATLAVGCRFAEVGTGSYGVSPPQPLIHVDIDPDVPGRNFPARLTAVADAAEFVAALRRELERRKRSAVADPELRSAIRDGRAAAHRDLRASSAGEGVNPARLLETLQGVLGPETIFATDSGNGTFLAAESLVLDRPGRFLAPVDYSCMGYSVPAAIGAALGRPTAPVVALVGDGAFLMTGLEIATAVREGTRVAFVILRDRELAQIAQFQETVYNRKTCAETPPYDVTRVAAGLGVEAIRVPDDGRREEAAAAIAAALRKGRPIVAEVAVDYSRKTFFTRGVVRTNFGRLPLKDRLRIVARALGRRITS